MAQYESYLRQVRKGQVGKLAPTKGETARALAVRISRAAKRVGKPADVWIVDGITYFKAR